MLDIRFIRENPELVAEKSKQKGYDVDVRKLLSVDESRRKLTSEVETVRAERNELAGKLKSGKPSDEDIKRGKELKEKLAQLEDQLGPVNEEFLKLLKMVPNMPADDVPVGASEDENVEVKVWGKKPEFDFEPKAHYQIAKERGWLDQERAAKIAGSRFVYVKGELVRLQFALMQYGFDVLTNEETLKRIIKGAGLKNVSSKPFVPVLPPAMARTEAFEATGRLNKQEQTYKIEDEDLWLNASAEHTLAPMYLNEILSEADLPLRYVGYTTAFRREAGTYGKDTEGMMRLHQFDKLEMESFTTPEDSLNEHFFMVAIEEYLMQQLELPYHLLNKCTADIGRPNARGMDLEAWFPSEGKYRETHTADYIGDYQSRGMNTRVRRKDGELVIAHNNDATAFSQRPLLAILENYQTKEGKIKVPKVLQPYMGGRTEI
ncbi:MAG TPA: serine--tRNA ligase [Candidatus Saccharimonadales bacterium]|nr:serine--tRNA ligase [Candidatus Saccharimonadales bacterium]